MPKIICHMQSGHPFTIKCGVQIPGKAKELEVTEHQLLCIGADCRVITYTRQELKAMEDGIKAKAKAAKEKAAEGMARQEAVSKAAEKEKAAAAKMQQQVAREQKAAAEKKAASEVAK